jgi:hypothetical protein
MGEEQVGATLSPLITGWGDDIMDDDLNQDTDRCSDGDILRNSKQRY